jgi:hypothetical protein
MIVRFYWIFFSLIILNCIVGCFEILTQNTQINKQVHLFEKKSEKKNHNDDRTKILSLIEFDEISEYPLIKTCTSKSYQSVLTRVSVNQEFYQIQFFLELVPPPPKLI